MVGVEVVVEIILVEITVGVVMEVVVTVVVTIIIIVEVVMVTVTVVEITVIIRVVMVKMVITLHSNTRGGSFRVFVIYPGTCLLFLLLPSLGATPIYLKGLQVKLTPVSSVGVSPTSK